MEKAKSIVTDNISPALTKLSDFIEKVRFFATTYWALIKICWKNIYVLGRKTLLWVLGLIHYFLDKIYFNWFNRQVEVKKSDWFS